MDAALGFISEMSQSFCYSVCAEKTRGRSRRGDDR
jgi:hypothetical protein